LDKAFPNEQLVSLKRFESYLNTQCNHVERKFLVTRQGSQVKRSSSWIAVLPSLVIPVCIGLMLYLGLSYLIQEGRISNETVLRYLTGHPVSKVTVGMFFIGIASLALIANNLIEQFGNERKITFRTSKVPDPSSSTESVSASDSDPTTETENPSDTSAAFGASGSNGTVSDKTVELGKRLLDMPKWMQDHYLWQRLVNALHSIYRTNSTTAVEDELKYLADMDLDRQQQRYSLVRILIWATPMLGFLGTVLGISQALGGISVGADNNFQQMMDGLRGSLYIAFDTTALALTLSMILMFGQFLVERFETQLLELVDQRAKQEINSQFDMTVATTEGTYENVAQKFLDASRESIELQTENWRKSIHAAEEAWVTSLGNANDHVQSQLCFAVDQSVSNLTSSLGAAIDKADTSMSHRWGQWQVTLSDNARLMANYQKQLSEQTDLIHQVLEQSKSKEIYQPALDQNREAVEATAQLRETLDGLAAVIASLQTKPEVAEPNAEPFETTTERPGVHEKPGPRVASVHPSVLANADVIFPTRMARQRVAQSHPSNRISKRAA
jgi:hypothetical protein